MSEFDPLCGEAMGKPYEDSEHRCFCVRHKDHPPISGDYRMHICICGRTTDEWVDRPRPRVLR